MSEISIEGLLEIMQNLSTSSMVTRMPSSTEWVKRTARAYPTLLSLTLAALLILGDYCSGVELTFTLLYLAPIALASWGKGRKTGIFVAAFCSASGLAIELSARLHHRWPLHPFRMFWNHAGALGIFVACVLLVARLHEFFEKEAKQRRLTLEQLRQAERLGTLGKLGAGLAHELGTPLNVIVGHAEMIGMANPTPATLSNASKTILAQAEKMTTILRGLLGFSRRSSSEKAELDVGALARDASTLLQPMAKKSGVAIAIDAESTDDVFVLGNRTELEQVLVNLIMNGLQAMHHGGTLHVRAHMANHVPDSSGSTPPPSMACLEVEDEGEGIPPEALPQIFDPFFTTKDVGSGTGLGLSVSYGIVSDHGGRITVDSKVGAGSRFSVFLPLAKK